MHDKRLEYERHGCYVSIFGMNKKQIEQYVTDIKGYMSGEVSEDFSYQIYQNALKMLCSNDIVDVTHVECPITGRHSLQLVGKRTPTKLRITAQIRKNVHSEMDCEDYYVLGEIWATANTKEEAIALIESFYPNETVEIDIINATEIRTDSKPGISYYSACVKL